MLIYNSQKSVESKRIDFNWQ